MNISKEEFKIEFFNKLSELNELNKEENGYTLKKYKIKSFTNPTNWFGTDLTKLTIKAFNEYDCWLQLHNILYKHSKGKYNLYDYDLIIECALENWYEEHEEEEDFDYTNLDFIVKHFIILFCDNDTLWYEEIM